MKYLSRTRCASPLPHIVVAFFLVAFSMYAMASDDSPKNYYAGVVNGDTIRLDEYSHEVGRLTEYMAQRGKVDPADVMEQAWGDIVRERLILHEARRRGLMVTAAQADSILLYATPDYVKRGIVDERGRFDAPLLRAMVVQPDSLLNANTRGLSAQRKKEEREQFEASMMQLRKRVAMREVEVRLRASVDADVPFDTTGLRERFKNMATSAVADVLLTPCGQASTQPSLAELRAYYSAHALEFTTPSPMRRLAFIAWPMKAAPIDSTLFLGNVRSFVSLLNNTRNPRQRDSIWRSVSSTTSSGLSRLWPDSANHAQFYAAVKGRKVGTAVGPLVHSSGVHVLLIDSVKNVKNRGAVVSVRVIVSEIEPSKQTIDSILAQVDEAAELYERGISLNTLSERYARPLESTKWFTDADKLFGSYRLADVAFTTPRNSACDPIDTPERGMVLAVVADTLPAGPLPFDAATERVAEAVMRDAACANVLPTAKSVRGLATRLDDGTMLLVEQPKGAQLARGLQVFSDGMIGETIFDPTATREILAKPYPDLYGPFLGEAGWYTVNVLQITKPTADEYELWLTARRADIEKEQKDERWSAFMKNLRSSASIEDNRWVFFRY